MGKTELLAILKLVPADARNIRVAPMWKKRVGDFEYVSFNSDSSRVSKAFERCSLPDKTRYIIRRLKDADPKS